MTYIEIESHIWNRLAQAGVPLSFTSHEKNCSDLPWDQELLLHSLSLSVRVVEYIVYKVEWPASDPHDLTAISFFFVTTHCGSLIEGDVRDENRHR